MPGQWEQRQFLARCPNNSAPRLHIYLPVWRNEKKKGGKERNTDWNRRVSVFIHAWRAGMCSCAWFASLNKPPLPPRRPLSRPTLHSTFSLRASHSRRHQKIFALKALGEKAAVTLGGILVAVDLLFGLRHVFGRGQSALALTCFSLTKELPLSPPFSFW